MKTLAFASLVICLLLYHKRHKLMHPAAWMLPLSALSGILAILFAGLSLWTNDEHDPAAFERDKLAIIKRKIAFTGDALARMKRPPRPVVFLVVAGTLPDTAQAMAKQFLTSAQLGDVKYSITSMPMASYQVEMQALLQLLDQARPSLLVSFCGLPPPADPLSPRLTESLRDCDVWVCDAYINTIDDEAFKTYLQGWCIENYPSGYELIDKLNHEAVKEAKPLLFPGTGLSGSD